MSPSGTRNTARDTTRDSTRDSTRDRARLIEIVKARSFQSGQPVTLASGKTSTYYFNMKPTMLDPEGARLIADLVLDSLAGVEADMIGGLEMGAVPLASAIAAVSDIRGRPLAAFFVRKQAKEHGTKSLVEGLPRGESMAGRRLVVVEDVTTTGGSALHAADALRAEGATIVRIVTVLDRLDGAGEAFAAAGYSFSSLLTLDDFRGESRDT
ncbi:MAG: orotate phosphoribosyltransferase [Hyphomicrobium sp.]